MRSLRRSALTRVLPLAAVLSLASVLATRAGATPGTAPPPARTAAIVSLGDSFIAGEGGRWRGNSMDPAESHSFTDRAFVPSTTPGTPGTVDLERVYPGTATNHCHRSDLAEINTAWAPGKARINLACSGATTANVLSTGAGGVPKNGEAPQDDRLAAVAQQYQVQAIVLSIGGNDLNFTGVVTACVVAFLQNAPACAGAQQPAVEQQVAAVRTNVTKVIDDVRATMAAAGYAEHSYQFVLQTYATPVPAAAQARYPQGPERTSSGGCPFYDADLDWARNWLVPTLDGVVADVARAQRVKLLELRNSLAGHELCAASASPVVGLPKAETAEWVRFVDLVGQGDLSESLHPNAFAQRAFGTCLSLMFWSPTDAECVMAAGGSPWGMTLRPLPAPAAAPAPAGGRGGR
jgi:lysophospholipase L1-like esterase